MTHENPAADTIEKDIVQTQNEISDTVNELQEKLQPQQLLRQVVGNPQQVPAQLFDAVKRNPVAAGLIGVGALWLLSGHQPKLPKLKNRAGNGQDFVDQQLASVPRYEGESEEIYQSRLATARASDFGTNGSVGGQSHGLRAKVGGLTQGLRDKVDGLTSSGAGEKLSGIGTSIKTRGQSATAWSSAKHTQEPLVTAVAAIAVGAVTALALPRTQIEREKLAPIADTAMSKVAGIKDQALQVAGEKLGGQQQSAQAAI